MRPALEQRRQPEQLGHLFQGDRAGAVREAAAVEKVLAHRDVRQQAPFLEHVADAAPVHRDVDARRGVEQRLAVERDAAALRAQQAGDRVQHAGLARAGAPEQRGDPAVAGESRVERERAEALADGDFELHAPWARRRARRRSTSDTTSALSESTTASTHRRSAWASPPGTWVRL